MTQLDTDQIGTILRQVSYKDGWLLNYTLSGAAGLLRFWWEFERPDAITGAIGTGRGPTTILDVEDMTEEQLVRKVFQSALAVEEHECREFFRYRGVQPFNPHVKLI